MKTKFTKGRWLIDGTRDTVCIDIWCNDEVIATCWDDNNNVEELRFNAKLIAAAPDLLHRLNSIVLSVKAHPDYVNGEGGDEWHDIVELAEQTIKKATE